MLNWAIANGRTTDKLGTNLWILTSFEGQDQAFDLWVVYQINFDETCNSSTAKGLWEQLGFGHLQINLFEIM